MMKMTFPANSPAGRLKAWLEDPEPSRVFSRRDIADLAILLDDYEKDPPAVWKVLEAASTEHDFPPKLDHALGQLYTRFYDRIWGKAKQ
jgi:hypothetical protein